MIDPQPPSEVYRMMLVIRPLQSKRIAACDVRHPDAFVRRKILR
jgi:hypothetical protein